MLLEGIFTAATTCFQGDGKLFLHKFERNIERYSRTAISGIVVLGSTGEAVMLSDDESRAVLRTAVQAASVDKVMIAGIGRESVIETQRLAEYAAEQRYDAVLVRTPHFYRPQLHRDVQQSAEMLNYYRMVADESPLPVLLYSIPSYTLYDLPIAIVAELAQHPNIIGIKDSSGNIERVTGLVEATRSIPARPVMVTPTFAPVTGRMLDAEGETEALSAAALVNIQQASGFDVLPMVTPATAPDEDTHPRCRLPGNRRFCADHAGFVSRWCHCSDSCYGCLRAPVLCRSAYGVEGQGCCPRKRKAGAAGLSQPADRRTNGYSRHQVCV